MLQANSFVAFQSMGKRLTGMRLSMAGGRSLAEKKMTNKMMFKQLRDKMNAAAQIPGFYEVGEGPAVSSTHLQTFFLHRMLLIKASFLSNECRISNYIARVIKTEIKSETVHSLSLSRYFIHLIPFD